MKGKDILCFFASCKDSPGLKVPTQPGIGTEVLKHPRQAFLFMPRVSQWGLGKPATGHRLDYIYPWLWHGRVDSGQGQNQRNKKISPQLLHQDPKASLHPRNYSTKGKTGFWGFHPPLDPNSGREFWTRKNKRKSSNF